MASIFNNKNKVKLKILREHHISKEYISWLNDYDVVKFTNQKFKKHNYNNVRKFVYLMLESKENFLFGIFYNNIHVGNIKIGPIDFNNKNTQISYFIGEKSYWGKGIAFEAIRKVLYICKKKYKLKKVMAYVVKENIGSIKVLKKNNFKIEGCLKKYFVFEKKRLDEIVFSIDL